MSRTAVVSRNAAETHTAAVKLRCELGPHDRQGHADDRPVERPHEGADRRQRQQLPATPVQVLVGDALMRARLSGGRHPGHDLVKVGARAVEGVGRSVEVRVAERHGDDQTLLLGAGQHVAQKARVADQRGGLAACRAPCRGRRGTRSARATRCRSSHTPERGSPRSRTRAGRARRSSRPCAPWRRPGRMASPAASSVSARVFISSTARAEHACGQSAGLRPRQVGGVVAPRGRAPP